MRHFYPSLLVLVAAFLAIGFSACGDANTRQTSNKEPSATQTNTDPAPSATAETSQSQAAHEPAQTTQVAAENTDVAFDPATLSPFVLRGISWLVEAQHPDGGWGAGSHAKQDIRDAHAVQTDPATTAFAAMALLRAGNSPVSGQFSETMRRATFYLLETVEGAPEEGPRITTLEGTQPQAKMGQLVDTALAAQYFARVQPKLNDDTELQERVAKSLAKCVRKLEGSQDQNGSWSAGGWAAVLQSSLSCSALEFAKAAGARVNEESLARAQKYQVGNVDQTSGRAATDAAAGVELYAFSAAQRAAAKPASDAAAYIAEAKRENKVDQDADVTVENLEKSGRSRDEAQALYDSFVVANGQAARLDDEAMLAGFGNNGGEEYLSYMMTSESLVIAGGETWLKWNDKILTRLEKVQSPDGSWSGHHCITSPVFCTAAVVQCALVDHDKSFIALARQEVRDTTGR